MREARDIALAKRYITRLTPATPERGKLNLMIKQISIAVPFIIAILFSACTKPAADLLRVTSELPSGVIRSDTVITLQFSRAVVNPESLNMWTNTPYIEFTPPVQGKFVWRDTSTLIFSPDIPFVGDAKFRGKINTDLLTKLSAARGYDGPSEFTFGTESFYLKSAEFFYDRIGEKRQIGIRANLEFTYGVNPADVAKHINVTIDTQPVTEVVAPTTQASRIIPIEVGVVSQTDRAKNISISFNQDLLSTETNTRIRVDRPFVFTLAGIEELKIYGHDFGFDGITSWISMKMSQEVDTAVARRSIVLEPARAYNLESDRQMLTLRGKFEPGTSFRVTIKKGLESVLEAKTQNDYEADIIIGNIKPSFRFASSSGVYMLLGGEKKIELKTLNLPKLAVRVSQVFQNNLTFFLDGGRAYDYGYYDYDYDYDDGGRSGYQRKFRYYLGNYGRQLWYDAIPINSITNQETTTLFDLHPHLKTDYRGFYLVEIANPAEPWRSTAKLISLSNLGLIVKQSENEMVVFVVNLLTTEPVQNAAVTIVSMTNQAIASARSDADGVARFSNFRERRKDFSPKLVTAELESDYNFINLADYRVETSRYEVDGKRDSPNGYDAFIYGDRNVYRPGEKVNLSGIVRNLSYPLPSAMPVRVKVFNPRGTMVHESQHTLNSEGSFETYYQTSLMSQTGTFRFELYTGNEVYLTSYAVSVEDFVPDRLKVSLTASKDSARPGESIKYELLALNFFGPPAANRNYEFEGMVSHLPYISKTFRDFRFSDDGAKNSQPQPEVYTGKTDREGRATIEYRLPKDLTSTGLLRARGRIAVFDESGRPVYQIAQATVYPKAYFIGLKNMGQYYASPNTPQKVQLIAVDPGDRPIADFLAAVSLIRFEWHSVLRQHPQEKTLRFVSERREIVERSDTVRLAAQPVEYTYSAPRSGEYVVRVAKVGDTGYNQFSFYSYSWGTTDVTSFEVDPEARIQMVFNDSIYQPGQKARILFQTPFSGKMLVTVERNQVFSHHFLDVVDNSASLEIPIDEKLLPNAYVSAVLFRKITDMNIPLLAGHGFAPLRVEKPSNKLDVIISAPEKIRPKTKQIITVKAGNERNVIVTLAAVDEGICQVKNYKTPDPYKYFYAKKALETETYDFFRHLIPEPERSSTGGSDESISKRVNPLGVQRFKPLAIWSGILKTNGSGVVEVPLDIPEFSGELRLMALAYRGDRFGSAERAMKVADPVVLTPALPRFVSPNDSVVMPITVFNTTDKSVNLAFTVEATGGLNLVGRPQPLTLGPNQERFVTATLNSSSQIGKAVVKVRTTAFGEELESVTELSIRPIAPFAAEANSGFVDGGGSSSHDVEDVYLPYGRKATLTLSPFPVVNFAKELKYLIGYPHGCIEQMVSKAFPQIYLRDLATMLDPSILNSGSPTYFVNEAITRAIAMQHSDGTFSYWPGGTDVYDWVNVYTTHFLIESRKAGYAIPDQTVNSALNALGRIARSKRTQDYYSYGPGQKVTVKRIADKSCLYALYVLALAGKAEMSVMNFYRTERSLLTTDTKFLLAGAFVLSGDRKTYLELLPPQFTTEEPKRETGGNFDTPVRANALILNILLETDLNNLNIPLYMDYLSRTYRSYRWYNTQDNAFTLLAFGKAARMASSTKLMGTIKVGTKEFTYTGGNQKLDIEPFGKRVEITMNGQGRVYYSLVTEGIRTDGKVKLEDRNLQVRREFLDRSGQQINPNAIKQNDLIIVRITLASSVPELDHIAITDLLPAGVEIENPRITENSNYTFITNPTTPEYVDIRDDRINFYTRLRGVREQRFYYMVRAVSAGQYNHAPVVAEAMYNAEYYSSHGGGKVSIQR